MTELCELAIKFGTDKVPKIRHSYTPFYHNMLKDNRSSIKKVLEMGTGRRMASLKMWAEYFPNATIYGADIRCEDQTVSDRIYVYKCNQYRYKDIKRVIKKAGNNYDLIIDDGSHVPKHQVFTANVLVPHLRNGGIYVIEDVIDPDYIASRLLFKSVVYRFRVKKIPDDSIIVIKHEFL